MSNPSAAHEAAGTTPEPGTAPATAAPAPASPAPAPGGLAPAPGGPQRPTSAHLAAPAPGREETWTSWLQPVAVQVLGWLALAVSCYPRLVSKQGDDLFKLDAWIYSHAISQWRAGGSLYDWYANPSQHLWPFTYTPFATIALAPLSWLPDRPSQVLAVLATPVAVAATCLVTARALGHSRPVALAVCPWVTLGACTVIEPVYKTMEYGQVNAVLMAVVAADLLAVPAGSRWRGVLSGVAAAIKLTPAVAGLVFLVRRQWRAAATMTLTSVGATAVCALMWPDESWQFFTVAMWDPSRAGFADYAGNQNLRGLIERIAPEAVRAPLWALAAALVLAGAAALAYRLGSLSRPCDHSEPGALATTPALTSPALTSPRPALLGTSPGQGGVDDGLVLTLQTCVAMTAGLLVSPISWSHHWVWCVPALWALAVAGRWHRPAGACAVVGLAVMALAMQWWFPEQNHVEQAWPAWAKVVGSSYTLWALGSSVVLWRWTGRARAPRQRRRPTAHPHVSLTA